MPIDRTSGAENVLEQAFDWIATLALRIHQSLDLEVILNIIVREVREMLECDRAIVYRFLPDGDGVIAEESVNTGCTPIQGQLIYDPCFKAKWLEQYRKGRIGIMEDIDAKPFTPCYKNLLNRLQIRAKLVVPILVRSQEINGIAASPAQPWGLLIVHQCSSPRQWQTLEIKLLQQVVLQLGIALQQAEMQQQWRQMNQYIESEKIALQESLRAEEELRWKEALLRSMTDSSGLAFYVVDNRTDEILYFNHRFCEIWGIEHLEAQMQLGELKNSDIIPDCLPLIADISAFAESCKPLQSAENRCTIEDEIAFVDGRTIRRFSSQIRDSNDRYFGRLYIFEDISDRKQAEIALKVSEDRWQFALHGNGDGVWDWNVQTNEVFFSYRWKEMIGFAEDEIGNTLDEWDKRVHPDDKARVYQEIEKHFRGETEQYVSEHRVECKDGTYKWILDRGKVISRTEDGRPLRVIGTHTDITERKLLREQALQQQAERAIYTIAQNIRQSLDLDEVLNTTVVEVRNFLQTDRVIVYRFNPDWSGVVLKESVEEGWLEILNMKITDTYFVEHQGQSYQQSTIRAISDIYTAGFDPCHVKLLERLQVRAKLIVPILQGERLWGLLVAHHCRAPRQWYPWETNLVQQLAMQVAIAIQQSELHQQLQIANQQLENLAMVDQLTQIANRRSFDRSLSQEWHRLVREQRPLSLLLCDIDYFKQYNDTYGHAAGDVCLTMVAQALKQAVQRSTDMVARYGGEEFAVILPNTDREGAIRVAQKIHEAIEKLHLTHLTSAVSQYLTLSIGISTVIPTYNMTPLDAIEAADRALYQAKSNGRNRWFANITCID